MPDEQWLWDALISHQESEFKTAKGLPFTYTVRGNELFVSRKEKSITRATVNMAYRKALDLQARSQAISGPKMLKTFGASYLYPVFLRIGVIRMQSEQMTMDVSEAMQREESC